MKAIRRRVRLLTACFGLMTGLMIAYFGYSVSFYGGRWIASPHNPRISSQKKSVVMGAVTDRDGAMLAWTNEAGERHYNPDRATRMAVSQVVGDSEGKVYTDQNVGDIKLGSIFPKSNMAWRNDFSWKGFNLGFMFSARFGGICYSATQANLDKYGVSEATAEARDRGYVLVNGNNYINPEVWYSTIGANDGIPQYYTYSATNIRLQEASIGYTFKKNVFFGIGDLTLSVIGRNLFMLYCKAPFDPEMTASTGNYYQGIDKFMTPSTRTIGFNAKLKF